MGKFAYQLPSTDVELTIGRDFKSRWQQSLIDKVFVSRKTLLGPLLLSNSMGVRLCRATRYHLTLRRHCTFRKNRWSCCSFRTGAPSDDTPREESKRKSLGCAVRVILSQVKESGQYVFKLGFVAVGNEYAVKVFVHKRSEKRQIGVLQTSVHLGFVGSSDGLLKHSENSR